MTKAGSDDYEAVRAVVAALEPFEPKDQERILRWAREKVGLAPTTAAPTTKEPNSEGPAPLPKTADIKTFIDYKNPRSESQLAAAIAYYYRFEAPEPQRKEVITSADLQDVCRQVGRERLKSPAQTLVNAYTQGYLGKL
jgi:hypothetical protein